MDDLSRAEFLLCSLSVNDEYIVNYHLYLVSQSSQRMRSL